MFRPMSGVKAQYHYLTLFVIAEFNEWRVLLRGPDTTIQGARQFTEAKAKEHAATIAKSYIYDEKHEEMAVPSEITWVPVTPQDWLVWG